MGLRGPAGAEKTDTAVGRAVVGHPVREEVVEDGIEIFFGRRPGFQEVEIRPGGVDGLNGGVGVGVGGQENAFGAGEDFRAFGEELGALHAGHALVGEEERGFVAAELELFERVKGRGAGIGSDDAVVLTVAAPQIAFNGAENFRFVVDGEDHGSWHGCLGGRRLPLLMTGGEIRRKLRNSGAGGRCAIGPESPVQPGPAAAHRADPQTGTEKSTCE